MGQLTELQIKAAQPRHTEYLLADGEGLYLRVRPTGKVWVYRYQREGKAAKLSFTGGTGWAYIVEALAASERPEDRALAREAANFAFAAMLGVRERGPDIDVQGHIHSDCPSPIAHAAGGRHLWISGDALTVFEPCGQADQERLEFNLTNVGPRRGRP